MSVTHGVWLLDDRYEVGEVIGRGGMGQVHRAHDLRLRRDVAIKFLRADLAAQPDARKRFDDEARNAARLTHPNVVLVLDTGEHDGTPYLVMECLPGRTLKDELAEGPLAPARATWVARDVLAGLAAAHEIGIVHRDVAPRNILMTETGRAKIADFGIAKAAESQSVTVVGQVLGTPAYVAPERLRGEPATPAADVYGLGATLYEAVSGKPPFTGDSAVAIAQQAVSTRPERLEQLRPDLPLDLVATIDHAMDPDPAKRPTAEELGASLAGEQELSAETTTIPVAGPLADTGAATVASPVVTPAARTARSWDERRVVLATVVIAVAIGLFLLALSDHAGSGGTPDRAEQTTVPTTAPPPPTTAATRVTSGVRAVVTNAPQVVVRHESPKGGGGKHRKR
ncbi:MAG: hypothetical protein QOG90_37 [Actinomycetota bacterium]